MAFCYRPEFRGTDNWNIRPTIVLVPQFSFALLFLGVFTILQTSMVKGFFYISCFGRICIQEKVGWKIIKLFDGGLYEQRLVSLFFRRPA